MGSFDTTGYDAVVIGAGQAGLAIGHHLARRGLRFVIVDGAEQLGDTWRHRWDTLRLFTPAQYDGLPGMPFPAAADTYPTKDEVAAYLESYAAAFDLPVRMRTRVTAVTRDDGRYRIDTAASDPLSATQVVVATGPFQIPVIPRVAAGLDAAVIQLHSGAYRGPVQVPDGRMLVVGGGNSGCQIAEELAATHPVDLAIGQRLPALPQRVAGRDLFWWLTATGLMRITAGSRIGRRLQQRGVTPAPGLYTLGLGWQHTRGSGLLGFVQDDAAHLAEQIARFPRHYTATGRPGSIPAPAPQPHVRT